MLSLTTLPSLILALLIVESASFRFRPPFRFSSPVCPADEDEPWSYVGLRNGPRLWGMRYPDCYGRRQSPVAINSQWTQVDASLPRLVFYNYTVPISKALVENNGHTVEVMPEDKVRRTIIVNGEEYELQQFHFHWGRRYNEGSEHTIDGTAYAMEMHLVHTSREGSVAVVAVFFKQEALIMNRELQIIIDRLPYLRYRNTGARLISPLVLNNLLPDNPVSFYRYIGSLTTPGCSEGVIWSVIPNPLPVRRSQMDEFRKLLSATREEASEVENRDCLLAPNYRPIQPLNGRQVYFSL